ncbi:MAG: hypothetical protein PHY15_00340 [Eubacteriales bacterium]|nr:hypothetical protein [Eubacteriales bacterium]MDD4475557.1 hypothetical protein [Eubacteriales bacterium]
MKTTITIIVFVTLFVYTGIVFTLIGSDLLTVDYYSDDQNYEDIECLTNAEGEFVIITSSSLYYDQGFHIVSTNSTILNNTGFFDEVKDNRKVIVTTAPKMFGDGWQYPIVGIRTEDKVYLEKSEGKKNLIDELNTERMRAVYFITPAVLSWAIIGVLFIFRIIRKRNFDNRKAESK